MTRPPCYKDGVDCPRRTTHCKADCPEWKRWETIHAQEKEAIRKGKAETVEADTFLAGQNKRASEARRREYMKEYNKRR